MPTPLRSRPGGFSLLELIVVLAIVGALAAIAVPRFARSIDRHRADAAARRIAADLNFAREQARLRSVAVNVGFELPADRLRIVGIPGLDDPTSDYITRLADEPYGASIDSATFGAGTTATFDGYGAPAAGGSVVISVGSETRIVLVNAATGEAIVQ